MGGFLTRTAFTGKVKILIRQRPNYKSGKRRMQTLKKRIIRGCLRIAILTVAGGVLGWLSSILFGERALITELPVVVMTLGASIGILSGVVLFPEKA